MTTTSARSEPLPPFVTARVSIAQLVADTELSERTVRRKLKKAERMGLIRQVGPAEFVFNIRALEALQRVPRGAGPR